MNGDKQISAAIMPLVEGDRYGGDLNALAAATQAAIESGADIPVNVYKPALEQVRYGTVVRVWVEGNELWACVDLRRSAQITRTEIPGQADTETLTAVTLVPERLFHDRLQARVGIQSLRIKKGSNK